MEELEKECEELGENAESNLMDHMSTIKRDAWLYIYNNWIQQGKQQKGDEFLELFRNWNDVLEEPKV